MTQELSIVAMSYYEHFKWQKELALCYPIDHPKLKQVMEETERLRIEMNSLKPHNHE